MNHKNINTQNRMPGRTESSKNSMLSKLVGNESSSANVDTENKLK